MPIQSVNQTQITEYIDTVHQNIQQSASRLMDYTIYKQISGDDFVYYNLDAEELNEAQGRNIKIIDDDANFTARKMIRRRFYKSYPVDNMDLRGANVNINEALLYNLKKAANRAYDQVIYDSLGADVLSDKETNFATALTFANDGGTTLDATAGLTYEQIVNIRTNFANKEVGNEENKENLVFIMTGDEQNDIFQETEFTSTDFSTQRAIDMSYFSNLIGMKPIVFGADTRRPIITVSSGVRDCYAFSSRAVCFGISKDITVEMRPAYDLLDSHRLIVSFEVGAVRTEGSLVQKVQTTPA